MRRRVQDFADRAALHHLALAQHRDHLAQQQHQGEAVPDEQEGELGALSQLAQQIDDPPISLASPSRMASSESKTWAMALRRLI